MSGFGNRLRLAMNQQGITDGLLAGELGLKRNTFNHYIHARAEPKFSTLCAISDTLGVSLHWLLTGEGPMDLPSADHSNIQTPPVDFLPVPDRGAEPARTASRAGITSEGESDVEPYQGQSKPIERALEDLGERAPSAFSAGFVDSGAVQKLLRAKRAERRKLKAERHLKAAQQLLAFREVGFDSVDRVDHVLKEHGGEGISFVDRWLNLGRGKIGRIFCRAFNVKTQRGGN